MWFWDDNGISWTICKQFARRCRQITTPIPHQSSRNFYSPNALPDAQPTMSNGFEWKCSKDTVICSRVLSSKIKRAAEFCRPTRCRSATVCDLGVFIDQDLTTKTHVQQTTSRCFATLRQLRSIRRYIPTSVFHSLVSALVLSPVSYTHLTLPTKRIV